MRIEPLPSLPSKIGNAGKMTMPDGSEHRYKIIDEITHPQSDFPVKIILLQRIKFDEDKPDEVRVCYYIIGKKPKMLGKWVFGQYAAFIPLRDFKALVRKAEKRGWI